MKNLIKYILFLVVLMLNRQPVSAGNYLPLSMEILQSTEWGNENPGTFGFSFKFLPDGTIKHVIPGGGLPPKLTYSLYDNIVNIRFHDWITGEFLFDIDYRLKSTDRSNFLTRYLEPLVVGSKNNYKRSYMRSKIWDKRSFVPDGTVIQVTDTLLNYKIDVTTERSTGDIKNELALFDRPGEKGKPLCIIELGREDVTKQFIKKVQIIGRTLITYLYQGNMEQWVMAIIPTSQEIYSICYKDKKSSFKTDHNGTVWVPESQLEINGSEKLNNSE